MFVQRARLHAPKPRPNASRRNCEFMRRRLTRQRWPIRQCRGNADHAWRGRGHGEWRRQQSKYRSQGADAPLSEGGSSGVRTHGRSRDRRGESACPPRIAPIWRRFRGAARISRLQRKAHPSAIAGTNTSIARSRFDRTASSPSNRAMMMLVSSRSLPLTGIYPLTVLFYRSSHFRGRHSIEQP